jgi:hypothetical protein
MGLLKKKEKPETLTDKKTEAVAKTVPSAQTAKASAKKSSADAEITAVIAAAISLFTLDVHDPEEYKMTIKRIDRPYSPWSSKLYMMRKWPR